MWAREGDFPGTVTFLNSAETATFRQMKVSLGVELKVWRGDNPKKEDRGICIFITPSSVHQKEVFDKCKQVFHSKDLNFLSPSVYINIRSKETLRTLEEYIQYFDSVYNRHEGKSELFAEIRELYVAHQTKKLLSQKSIPDVIVAKPQVHPHKKNSDAMYYMVTINFSLQKLKEYLMAGEDPNQTGVNKISVLYALIEHVSQVKKEDGEFSDVIVTAGILLVAYGANFTSCLSGVHHHETVYEASYRAKDSSPTHRRFYAFMTDAINYKLSQTLKKNLKSHHKVRQFEVYAIKDGLLAYEFKLNNKSSITGKLVELERLDSTSRVSCYTLFKKYFKDPHGDEKLIQDEFKIVFSPKNVNALVNMIHFTLPNGRTKFAGLNVFEVAYTDNKLAWHSWYTIMEPECRGEFTPFFAYGFAHASQMNYHDMNVDVYFNPVEYNALSVMNVATEMVATPKYRSPYIYKRVDTIHKQLTIYRDGVKVIAQGMHFGVQVDSIVSVEKPEIKSAQQHPMKTVFDQHIKIPNGYPAVAYPVADQSVGEFDKCAMSLNVDTESYLRRVRMHLAPWLFKVTGVKPSAQFHKKNAREIFCDAIRLFYLGERVPGDKNLKFTAPAKQASL